MVHLLHLCSIMIVKAAVGEEWHQVFGVSNGGAFGIYDLYCSSNSLRECNVSITDMGVNTQDHYKSKLLTIWDALDVTRVKLSLFKDGEEVAFFVFNGIGSDSTNWMDDARLINSSYAISDLQSGTNNYFSISGHFGVNFVSRRFFINRSYAGCGGDYGWIFVLDQYANVCDEDRKYSVNIYYSPHPTYSHYSDLRIADSLAVFIQGDSMPTYCCQASRVETTVKVESTQKEQTREIDTTTDLIRTTDRDVTSDGATSTVKQTTEITEELKSTLTSVQGFHSTTASLVSLERKLIQIKKALTIDKNATVLFHRSKRCAEDPRYSAKVVGNTLGTGLLIFLCCLILLPDLQKALSIIFTPREK